MKNKFFSLVAMAVAVFAMSCSNDNLATETGQQSGATKTVTLEASMGNDNTTRVGMSRDNQTVSLYWHDNDKISVQTKSQANEVSFSNTAFSIAEGTETGATEATFTGSVAGGEEVGSYALYPYSGKHKFASNGITYNLPGSYAYTTVAGNIFSKTTEGTTSYPANSTCMPMLGTISGGKATFKHLGGLVVVRIDEMPAAEGTLTVTANEQLSGDFKVDQSAETLVLATASTDTEADQTVKFSFEGASEGGEGVFYLPLATGSYSGVKIAVACSGTTQTINYGNLYVARASVTAIPLYTHGGKLSKFSKIDGNVYTLNGHKFIDLCFDSGLLWAETNIGAETESDYGKYYAWGEVTAYNETTDWGSKEIKTNYAWSTYKYGTSSSTLTKYYGTDSKETLEAEDDAATRNWGNGCRMPTKDEFDKLTWTGDFTWDKIGGLEGYKITSRNSDYTNPIFLPAAGGRFDNFFAGQTTYGRYWSSSLKSGNFSSAHILLLSSNRKIDDYNRWNGYPVRPVAEK